MTKVNKCGQFKAVCLNSYIRVESNMRVKGERIHTYTIQRREGKYGES